MRLFTTVGFTILTVGCALAALDLARAAEPRSKEQCAQIFHRLNTSGTGRLTINEVALDAKLARELDDPNVWRNGYVTEDEFTPLCMQGGSKHEPTSE